MLTFSASTQILTVSTSSGAKVGTYSLLLKGVLDTGISTSLTFSVIIMSHCYGQTLTASTIGASYYVLSASSLAKAFTAFTASSGVCSSITYTLSNSDSSAYDTSVFTFTSSTN